MLRSRYNFVLLTIVLINLNISSCSTAIQSSPDQASTLKASNQHLERHPDVPELPFPDNPDPNNCGIPTAWGTDEPAWVSGYFLGNLIQPSVYLYDSHLRLSIAGIIPTGGEVKIILYQQNPTLDYYLVKSVDLDQPQEGWIPSPFLSFEPIN